MKEPQTPFDSFWSIPPADLLPQLKTSIDGLTQTEAQSRLAGGAGMGKQHPHWTMFILLLSQFKSPIILILIFTALLSLFLKDTLDAAIILVILLVLVGIMGFYVVVTETAKSIFYRKVGL